MLVIGEIDTIFFYRKHAYILPTIKKKIKIEREKERERENNFLETSTKFFLKKLKNNR